MANPHKGEVSFDANGAAYTLRYSINAICELENETGKGIVALMTELEDPTRMSMTLARQIMWAGLREHHPDITVKAAGELISAAGGLMRFVQVLNTAFAESFGIADGKENPPKAGSPNGTGPRSTGPGRASGDRPTTSGKERRAN
jgi:hypothetical protein